jgi:hypothetical protein
VRVVDEICSRPSALVLDLVLGQVGAEGFVKALDEAGWIVVDEVVEIGFQIGLEHVFAVLGEDEAEFLVGVDVDHRDLGFVVILFGQRKGEAAGADLLIKERRQRLQRGEIVEAGVFG